MDEQRPGQPGLRLELREQPVDVVDVLGALDLRHHDHVELVADLRHERGQVVEHPRRVEAVDPRPELGRRRSRLSCAHLDQPAGGASFLSAGRRPRGCRAGCRPCGPSSGTLAAIFSFHGGKKWIIRLGGNGISRTGSGAPTASGRKKSLGLGCGHTRHVSKRRSVGDSRGGWCGAATVGHVMPRRAVVAGVGAVAAFPHPFRIRNRIRPQFRSFAPREPVPHPYPHPHPGPAGNLALVPVEPALVSRGVRQPRTSSGAKGRRYVKPCHRNWCEAGSWTAGCCPDPPLLVRDSRCGEANASGRTPRYGGARAREVGAGLCRPGLSCRSRGPRRGS